MLKSANIEVYVAEFNPKPGVDLNDMIKQHIEQFKLRNKRKVNLLKILEKL